jgi:hypothetical protein
VILKNNYLSLNFACLKCWTKLNFNYIKKPVLSAHIFESLRDGIQLSPTIHKQINEWDCHVYLSQWWTSAFPCQEFRLFCTVETWHCDTYHSRPPSTLPHLHPKDLGQVNTPTQEVHAHMSNVTKWYWTWLKKNGVRASAAQEIWLQNDLLLFLWTRGFELGGGGWYVSIPNYR